jgi:subtilisin
MSDFFIKRVGPNSIENKLPDSQNYFKIMKDFEFQNKGGKVKICLLSTGVPSHCDVMNIKDMENFSADKNILDEHGNATTLSGFITSDNPKGITGLSTNAELTAAKIFNKNGKTNTPSIVAGLLWAIIKKSNVVVLPLATNIDDHSLKDAINKAVKQQTIILTPFDDKNVNIYPFGYNNVIGVNYKTGTNKKWNISAENNIINIKPPRSFKFYTTYGEGQYAKMTGRQASLGIATSVVAIMINNIKKKRKRPTREAIIKEINVFFS